MTNNSDIELNGLVLAGGKSTRMHHDKTLIKWHGKEQRYHLANLLSGFCKQVFISCRAEQEPSQQKNYLFLKDAYSNIGPMAGLLTAFSKDSTSAWLVTACDMPFLDQENINYLISQRAPNLLATCYKNPDNGLPEPLVTIWEPTSYPLLLTLFKSGNYSLRKILINQEIKLLEPLHLKSLTNVNTPQEASRIKFF